MLAPLFFLVSSYCLPELFQYNGIKLREPCDPIDGFFCVLVGLAVGVAIAHICNFYTSKDHSSVKEVAKYSG